MPKIIGFSIAKNALRETYPIDLVMLQHRNLFDEHWIGVPKQEQDEDNTIGLIEATALAHNINVRYFELDWPGKGAWTEESLDRTHQQKMIDFFEETASDDTWLIKIDADEFYWEGDFEAIKEAIELCHEAGINSIWTGYHQFVGSVENTVADPTHRVYHIFRNKRGVRFGGNDAMILTTTGEMYPLEDVHLHHIGYVKDPMKITTRIREHIVLNQSMYPGTVIPSNWQFEFPKHKVGAHLWPLGIAVIRGAVNEVEYFPYPEEKLPLQLRIRKERFRFFRPEF